MFVASVHQNSTWWKRFTLNRSDFGLALTKFLKPTNLNPVWVWVWVSVSMAMEIVVLVFVLVLLFEFVRVLVFLC